MGSILAQAWALGFGYWLPAQLRDVSKKKTGDDHPRMVETPVEEASFVDGGKEPVEIVEVGWPMSDHIIDGIQALHQGKITQL